MLRFFPSVLFLTKKSIVIIIIMRPTVLFPAEVVNGRSRDLFLPFDRAQYKNKQQKKIVIQ